MKIITLLTDFGTRDYFVGAMKGVILSINPNVNIIDISHEIEPQRIRSGAFVLENSYSYFPKGTIHVAVIDPGVGSQRRAILVQTEDYFFIAPDNGILSFILTKSKNPKVFSLEDENYFLKNPSSTFHGRDIFAPVAAHLSKGVSPSSFGKFINDPVIIESYAPQFISYGRFIGRVIHIDRFGNLITNFKAENLPKRFVLRIGDFTIDKHLKFYSQAQTDEPFSIVGSAGLLEISVFKGSAKQILGASIDQAVELQTIE
ncbi:MAG: SAM-dependent chlorinase/fluorinase [Pyrinomonadaceae bacterium]|nr:SAM-dependent chlorinase/fluorinase [Pyrinomonadaceae bacterium]MCX7638844.1 SAM-dependent chlorinase/fluorinase [Pyrinomonadaceae bacterium]MDW8305020.1 SAM-dependent chlorinase/fluorinase [Acidobacteriota bacterium]